MKATRLIILPLAVAASVAVGSSTEVLDGRIPVPKRVETICEEQGCAIIPMSVYRQLQDVLKVCSARGVGGT